jgi:Fe-S oxidoreductase
MKSARVKAEQIKATGATTLVTACENCHTQLNSLNEHYNLGTNVKFLSSMIADALIQ